MAISALNSCYHWIQNLILYSKTDFLFSLLHATQPGSPLLFFDFHDKSTEKSLYIVEFIGGLGQREVVYLKGNEQFIFDCTVTLFFKVFWLSYCLNFPLPTCHLKSPTSCHITIHPLSAFPQLLLFSYEELFSSLLILIIPYIYQVVMQWVFV